MKTNPTHKLSAMALFVMAAIGAQANLVVNGGFETGNFNGWSTLAAGTGSDFGIINQGHTGQFSAQFSGNATDLDRIWQMLPTSNGTSYTISFWILNYGAGEDKLELAWENGTDVESPLGYPLEDWSFVSINKTATMNGSKLGFGGYDNNASFLIDDISVEVVPEPATMAALGIGALCVLRRKRTR